MFSLVRLDFLDFLCWFSRSDSESFSIFFNKKFPSNKKNSRPKRCLKNTPLKKTLSQICAGMDSWKLNVIINTYELKGWNTVTNMLITSIFSTPSSVRNRNLWCSSDPGKDCFQKTAPPPAFEDVADPSAETRRKLTGSLWADGLSCWTIFDHLAVHDSSGERYPKV